MIFLIKLLNRNKNGKKRMIIRFFIGIIFLLFCVQSFANIKSKTKHVKPTFLSSFSQSEKNDTLFINEINKIANTYFKSNPDSTIYFSLKGIEFSKKINYKNGLAFASLNIGHAYYFKGQYQKAKQNLDHAIKLFVSLDNKKGLAECYVFYAQMLNYQADYKTSLIYLSKALEINKLQKNDLAIAECYNHFGLTYFNQGKLLLALDYYYKALSVYVRERNNLQTASIYNNIGDVLQNLDAYPLALTNYQKALNEARKVYDLHEIGNAYENIGEIYLAQNKYDEAINYLLKANQIAIKMDNKNGISYVNADLGLCYAHKNDFSTAFKYLDSGLLVARNNGILYNQTFALISYATALNLKKDYNQATYYALKAKATATKINNIWFLTNIVQELYKSYAGEKKYDLAFKYSNKYNILKDSLKSTEGIQKLTTYNLNLNFSEKQHRLEIQQQERDIIYQQKIKQQRINLIFISIILVLAVVLLFYYLQKQRQQKTIETLGQKNDEIIIQKNAIDEQAAKLNDSNALKDSLIGILAHDLRGPLSTLNGVFYLLVEEMITHEEMVAMVPNALKKLQYTSDFLDTLLFWINSQVENLGNSAKNFCLKELVVTELSNQNEFALSKGINLIDSIPPDLIVFAEPDYIKIVIRNLVGNALKFSGRNNTVEVLIGLEPELINGTEYCIVEVRDNGIGMSEEQAKKLFKEKVRSGKGTNNEMGTGIAMLFCKDLVEKSKGRIWVNSKEGIGTTFSFTLPVGNS